ncbi:hypothetical protein P4S64_15320 [Vibrio sp. M60_M31a]
MNGDQTASNSLHHYFQDIDGNNEQKEHFGSKFVLIRNADKSSGVRYESKAYH